MYLTFAFPLLSLSWPFWACAAHRRPVPAAWTRSGAASAAVVPGVPALLPIGSALAVLATPMVRRPPSGLAGSVAK